MRSHPGRIFFAFLAPLTRFCTHRAPNYAPQHQKPATKR